MENPKSSINHFLKEKHSSNELKDSLFKAAEAALMEGWTYMGAVDCESCRRCLQYIAFWCFYLYQMIGFFGSITTRIRWQTIDHNISV